MNVIPYRACYVDKIKKTMLFSSSIFNGIFRMDLENGDVQYVGMIQNERVFQESLYGDMAVYEKWLLLIPLMAQELAVLDRESGQCVKKIKLPGGEKLSWKFTVGITHESNVILIPGRYPFFLSVNMIDFSITVLQNWKTFLETKEGLKEQKQLAAFTVGKWKSFLYIQILDTNRLLKFDIEEKQIIHVLNISEGSYAFAVCDEKNIYAVPSKKGKILCISPENEKIEKVFHMPISIEEDVNGFVSVHGKIFRDRLILFPQCATRIGVLDVNSGKIDNYSGIWSVEKNGKQKNIFQKVEMIDDRNCIALVCHENKKDYGCFLIDMFDFTEKPARIRLKGSIEDILRVCVETGVEQNEIINEHTLHLMGAENILASFAGISKKNLVTEAGNEKHLIGAKIFDLLEKD